jgi:hypothetical protein
MYQLLRRLLGLPIDAILNGLSPMDSRWIKRQLISENTNAD